MHRKVLKDERALGSNPETYLLYAVAPCFLLLLSLSRRGTPSSPSTLFSATLPNTHPQRNRKPPFWLSWNHILLLLLLLLVVVDLVVVIVVVVCEGKEELRLFSF